MKNVIKLGLLSAIVAILFSACSEPKSVQYYEDPKNAKELEAKIKECDKNANSAETDTECANAYKARYSKSLQNFQNEKLTDEEIKKYSKHRDSK
ncbi:EexN family lipoprotein [Campylobacter felis]|uniref:EexN family lipoprotein n=1 Tax=Campylobacter felis TaxID=2974565 RepID=A0ABT7I2J6_9BACT|nr:EexN family lipoprotein [Campylobacter upsaliensis]MDL0101562.1 EexN family lipoprotein [Campylobacter felis]MDL0107916.1 EexN family lipoprotein [Campylobacter felis]MDL0146448.1 EexN family lipoprotein [Campylobacter felis]